MIFFKDPIDWSNRMTYNRQPDGSILVAKSGNSFKLNPEQKEKYEAWKNKAQE